MDKYHVLGLFPRQQLAVRYLLDNLYNLYVSKLLGEVYDSESRDIVTLKQALALRAFNDRDQLVNLLATPEGLGKAKAKILQLSPGFMRNINFAIKAYDPGKCTLDRGEIHQVDDCLTALTTLVEDSIKYTYTEEEIRKWMNQSKR